MELDTAKDQAAGKEPVLGYALQQRRWERGVAWLVGIVCVSQVLMLPGGACEGLRFIAEFRYVHGLPYWAYSWQLAEATEILRTGAMALVGFLCAIALMGVKRSRNSLKACIWITLGLTAILAVEQLTNETTANHSYWARGFFVLSEANGLVHCHTMILG